MDCQVNRTTNQVVPNSSYASQVIACSNTQSLSCIGAVLLLNGTHTLIKRKVDAREVFFDEIHNIIAVLSCISDKAVKDCGPRNTRPVSLASTASDKIPVVVTYHCLNRLRHVPPNELSYRVTCEWLLCCIGIFFKKECKCCIEVHKFTSSDKLTSVCIAAYDFSPRPCVIFLIGRSLSCWQLALLFGATADQ